MCLRSSSIPRCNGCYYRKTLNRWAVWQEAAVVEAETQKVFAENQSLNKQQGALNAEVGA